MIEAARRLRLWLLRKEGALENSAAEGKFCYEWRQMAAKQSRSINIIWPLVHFLIQSSQGGGTYIDQRCVV